MNVTHSSIADYLNEAFSVFKSIASHATDNPDTLHFVYECMRRPIQDAIGMYKLISEGMNAEQQMLFLSRSMAVAGEKLKDASYEDISYDIFSASLQSIGKNIGRYRDDIIGLKQLDPEPLRAAMKEFYLFGECCGDKSIYKHMNVAGDMHARRL